MYKYALSTGLVILAHANAASAFSGSLLRGSSIFSNDGRFQLTMQNDGNLVLYGLQNRALWASGTFQTNADRAVMDPEGNFAVYDGATRLWSSNTHGNPGSALVVQDDGNVVIYSPGGTPIWATGTDGLGARVPRLLVNNSSSCLDVYGWNGVANLTNVQTWNCDEVSETWYLGLDNKLHAGWDPHVCLDVLGTNSSANGTNADVFACDAVTETWTLDQDGRLQAQWDPQVCLDVDGINSSANGSNVQIWHCGEVTETWHFGPSSMRSDWMGQLLDRANLSTLSIPGTHDSIVPTHVS